MAREEASVAILNRIISSLRDTKSTGDRAVLAVVKATSPPLSPSFLHHTLR